MADDASPPIEAHPLPAPDAPASKYPVSRTSHLKPIKPGERRNPNGTNSWKKAQARIAAFMRGFSADGKTSRWEKVLLAAYTSALVPGPKGAPDRRLLIEQYAGRAKVQVDVNANVSGLRVLAMLPDNGHGPGEDPEGGGDAGPGAE